MSGSKLHIVKFSESSPSRDKCREIVQKILQSELGYNSPPKLSYDELGKPSIEENSKLAFSYAHSPSQLVIVIDSAAQSIGIDTEPVYRHDEIAEMAKMAFSSRELTALKSSEYIMAWCRKEAAVKRLGKGFREADPFEFSVVANHKSYKLYLGDSKIHDGYFLNLVIDDNVIVICSDKPTENFSLYRHALKDIQVKD